MIGRNIFFGLLIILSASLQASAQLLSQRTTVGASATMIDNLSLITIRDVNMNGPSSVDGIVTLSPLTSGYAGLMRINGRPGRLVRISFLAYETLLEETGTGGIVKANYQISGFEEDNQLAATLLNPGEATIKIGKDGTYHLWLGALLDLSKASPGSYISEFLIEIEGN